MGRTPRQISDIRVVVFMAMAGVVALLLYFLLSSGHSLISGQTETESADEDTMTATKRTEEHRGGYYYAQKERVVETFNFDPNTADSTALLRLGLAPYQVRGIYKYRAMGGVYHQREDFARVPGLTVKDYRRLAPHIVIGADYQLAANVVSRPQEVVRRDTAVYPQKLERGHTVNVNHADTSALKHIPGIGSYYARAIVRYREQLGGYASKQQLMEIGGFPEEALDFIAVDSAALRKIKINGATFEELRRHPYLRYYRAKRIVDYRRLYGRISSLRQLLSTPEFTEDDILRLEPYMQY